MLHQSENPVMLSHLRIIKRNTSYTYMYKVQNIYKHRVSATESAAAAAAALNGHQINYTENLSPKRQLLSQIELH